MIILIIQIKVSYDQNISSNFYVKDGSHVRLRHPSCGYITAQRQYAAVQKITFLALEPWSEVVPKRVFYEMGIVNHPKLWTIIISREVTFLVFHNPVLIFHNPVLIFHNPVLIYATKMRIRKKLRFSHKLKYYNPYICASWIL